MSLISEDHILSVIELFFPKFNDDPRLPGMRGDDCAIIRAQNPLCVSTDWFLEDIHFRRKYFSPADIGWKALAVNLSDLAACGANPLAFSLALSLPRDTDMEFLHGLLTGLSELSELTNTPLIGGDLSQSDKVNLCLTVYGEAEKPLERGLTRPGDALFLIGQVGLAKTGFIRLEAEGSGALKSYPQACAAHLRPEALLEAGQILHELGRKNPEARLSLMDVSDGLARDIPRLLGLNFGGTRRVKEGWEQEIGADISLPPPHPEIARYCAANEINVDRFRLSGGEDYALTGSCAAEFLPRIMQELPQTWQLGLVDKKNNLRCNGEEVEPGFDHFA